MIDLKDYINEMIGRATVAEKATPEAIATFLDDNGWFGLPPSYKEQKVLINDKQVERYTPPLLFFLCNEKNSELLLQMLAEKFRLTHDYLQAFFADEDIYESVKFAISDFLLYYLEKDIMLYTNSEVSVLVQAAANELTKFHGDVFTLFLAWLRATTKTRYNKDFIMEKRYTMEDTNGAYEFDEYLNLMYFLFNKDYIEENDMYAKAAKSKNYTDTWLFLSLHFICSLRYTDLVRIYHPDIADSPEEVIRRIQEDEFTDNEARMVLLSVTQRLCMLPFTPSKTATHAGIGSAKFHIPTSCEVHFGKLFALAEAHWRLAGRVEESLIRKIATYEDITRYMGEEIGELFLESDFRSRSATKSYLQVIYLLSDEVLGEKGPRLKGYILAALARSHKGSYGEFATTTFEYLKDAKLSGLTPEFVAFELLERGVLSSVTSMLLKMITEDGYNNLSVKNQTALIKAVGLTPFEIESTVAMIEQGSKNAKLVVKEVISSGADILTTLHNLGNGDAFSKEPECLCLRTAMGRSCPYAERRQCVGCQYEVNTKATLYLLISEYNRYYDLYSKVTDPLEKNKYKRLATEVALPKLSEMLSGIKENYGEDVFQEYENFLKENLSQ